jgi:hypothetical protein
MTSDHAAVESEGLVLVLLDGLAVHSRGHVWRVRMESSEACRLNAAPD